MRNCRKLVNLICISVTLLSLLTLLAAANAEPTDNTEAQTTETAVTTEPVTEETTTEERTTAEITEPEMPAPEPESDPYIDYEPTVSEATTQTYNEEPETSGDDDYDGETSKHESGTKATRTTVKKITTTTKAVEKNITDYGKKYGWMKWICYILIIGCVTTLIVYNVKCAQNNAGPNKGSKQQTNRRTHGGSDIRSGRNSNDRTNRRK